MNSYELYNKIISEMEPYSYPFRAESNGDYYDKVCKLFSEFETTLKKLDPESVKALESSLDSVKEKLSVPLNLMNDFEKIKKMTKNVIAFLFEGEPAEAYAKLETFFVEHNLHYTYLLPQLHLDKEMVYYRIREGLKTEENASMKQKDLFHVPFEKRHKIASMRYSVPGYPIFYVAGSLKMAYQATVKNEHDFTYVKIKGKEDLKFVDLAFPIEKNPQLSDLYSLFVFYPLISACTMRVAYKKDVYKAEYALPQLLTQYVKKHTDFDGITYVPPEIDDCYSVNELRSHDFAIIVRGGVERSGYDSKLAAKYLMTKPLVFMENDPNYQYKKNNVPVRIRDVGTPQDVKHWKCRFAYLEKRDKEEPFTEIDLT